MKAEIIAIGTEILLGDIVNTNAQYLSKQLADNGIDVYHQSVIGDNEERVLEAFKEGFKRADIIITTGGLGPTKDDLTKEMASKYFNRELILDEESLKYIESYFKKNGRELKGGNKKQAYFPKGSIVLPNPNGTAPGAIIEEENKIIIILPGPPREMKPMFKNYVMPYLNKFTNEVLVSKVLRIFGIGEGYMAEKIEDLIDNQSNPTIAPYAKDKDVTLRITAKAKDKNTALKIIEPVEKEIRERLGDNIYGEGEDTTLEEVVAKKLISKNLTISTAESCTGGMLASTLINYPGISKVFLEGAVTYSNEAKIKRLGVKKETLDKYGAVSEETAREMALGIAKTSETNIGLSTTGLAGPDGGTKEKPVGLVYIGLSINGEVRVKKLNLQGDRQKIRIRTVMNILDWLRREI
ncbi:competence/damage-inducible protein A [Clostridium fallax]|uniref:Putative competence-damage inducible protein n=1 Tax=Clostridium fallax TaxID=1533 RepID=A0A1M4YUJ9_9CLOT|nr:competence/damage-inducible protein A [Clostridium fallax]SHF09494.1 competence/damage-inducible protein cinA [Clostridium fallax]SQB22169.1 competence damage-inducible protein A [Clostridium fallax]